MENKEPFQTNKHYNLHSPLSLSYRFNSDIDCMTGYKTKTMMCSPIKDHAGCVIGVAQVSIITLSKTFPSRLH